MPDVPVAFAIGSNIGDRLATLQGAVDDLAGVHGVTVVAVSPVVETDPVGGPEQDDYLNAVVIGTTDLDPLSLLDATQAIEQRWHRTREVRWGPRTLDIDLLMVGDLVLDTDRLTLPHPRAHERGFVLVPWASVDPHAVIPGHDEVVTCAQLVGSSGVRSTPYVLTLPEADHR